MKAQLPLRAHLSIGLLLLHFVAPARASTLQCFEIPVLLQRYLENHYAYHKLTPTLKEHTVDQFIKSMDRSKTMLLEADTATLKQQLMAVFSGMAEGNCLGLGAASDLMLGRANESLAYVRSFLGNHYNLDESTKLVLDAKKRAYPKTEQEKQALLQKMVHFQISNYLLSDTKLADAKKQLIHRYELVAKHLSENKLDDKLSAFVESFALGLDPHSSYLTKDNTEEFQIAMRLSLEGIGASLMRQDDGYTVVDRIIPGGSADRAKTLHRKDKIIAVAQEGKKPEPVVDWELRKVVKLIRGKKGTKVHLTVLRQQGKRTKKLTITLVRDKIDIKDQAAKLASKKVKRGDKELTIGILDLSSFYGSDNSDERSSSNDIQKLLTSPEGKKLDALVLDLSRNGGGLLHEAVKISELFLQHANVVATKDQRQKIQVLSGDDPPIFAKPMVALISRFSASASEILAGVLKDYGRAAIVGSDHSFGKGTVQAVSPVPGDLGSMIVTTGMFFRPSGKSTQRIGVESDIRLPQVYADEDYGESELDYALANQNINAFLSKDVDPKQPSKHWTPITSQSLSKLSELSMKRVSGSVKFKEIAKKLEEAKQSEGEVKLADLRKRTLKESKKDKKKKDEESLMERERDREQPLLDEAAEIAADLIAEVKT